jgi:hypothetical protein
LYEGVTTVSRGSAPPGPARGGDSGSSSPAGSFSGRSVDGSIAVAAIGNGAMVR